MFEIITATSFRSSSEDRLAVHPVTGGRVFVVADGAGGIPGGALAADLVLALVEHAIEDPHFNPFGAGSWANVLVEADGEIERDQVAGETTAVVVAVRDEGELVGASCGESGALLIESDGAVTDLAEGQQRKNRLGSGRASPVPFRRALLAGTTLVVATDGLLAYVRPDVISRVIAESQDLDEAARALVDCVRLPSGDWQDDVALVLVRATR